jgi:hypothetical protein
MNAKTIQRSSFATRAVPLFLCAVACGYSAPASAGTIQIDLTSVFNIDGVANPGDTTQSSLDQPNTGGNFVFPTQSLAETLFPASPNGLPDNGFFPANASHPDVQLAYGSDPDDNNVLQFAGAATGTSRNVTVPAGTYSKLDLFAMSGGGDSGFQLQFNYASGAPDLIPAVTVHDWFYDSTLQPNEYYLINGLDRVQPDQTGYEDANNPAIFGYAFAPDPTRVLLSFDVLALGTDSTEPRLDIFGATAVAVPEPAALSLLAGGLLALLGRRAVEKPR